MWPFGANVWWRIPDNGTKYKNIPSLIAYMQWHLMRQLPADSSANEIRLWQLLALHVFGENGVQFHRPSCGMRMANVDANNWRMTKIVIVVAIKHRGRCETNKQITIVCACLITIFGVNAFIYMRQYAQLAAVMLRKRHPIKMCHTKWRATHRRITIRRPLACHNNSYDMICWTLLGTAKKTVFSRRFLWRIYSFRRYDHLINLFILRLFLWVALKCGNFAAIHRKLIRSKNSIDGGKSTTSARTPLLSNPWKRFFECLHVHQSLCGAELQGTFQPTYWYNMHDKRWEKGESERVPDTYHSSYDVAYT